MKRMNMRDVPDEVYAALVERLAGVAQALSIGDYLAICGPPSGTGVTVEDATAAVREVRDLG